ncbi:PPOX class F420-dependent oxidoreductase [Blastococcus sp. URHD0036]|uniref:PPOX class F420-dependent oxidoreductase n=1 Tax=Blastococcus sp. URHD0036 TaxID=1380356 RepID=UPI0004982C22|nr:PPOX class F420-dependent oxidoreductase [Blastococcus sp. URHD0036]
MTVDSRLLDFVATRNRGVLATLKRDGRPQLSTIGFSYDAEQRLFRVSVTADRAKTRNAERDPRVTLHVNSDDYWTWAAVDGTADLSPVASGPHDDTVEELVAHYRAVSGKEHPDWDGYRAALVTERRQVLRFTAEHTYGRIAD